MPRWPRPVSNWGTAAAVSLFTADNRHTSGVLSDIHDILWYSCLSTFDFHINVAAVEPHVLSQDFQLLRTTAIPRLRPGHTIVSFCEH